PAEHHRRGEGDRRGDDPRRGLIPRHGAAKDVAVDRHAQGGPWDREHPRESILLPNRPLFVGRELSYRSQSCTPKLAETCVAEPARVRTANAVWTSVKAGSADLKCR